MSPMLVHGLSVIFLFTSVTCQNPSDYYYWREYTGAVPPDAFPAGRDPDGRPTYIGEAYIHGHGVYAAQIYPGRKEVEVPCYGFKTATINIKILCTDYPEYFHWHPTSAANFKKDVENVKALKVFYDGVANNGVMNLGRIYYQGYVIVGDVTIYKNPQLWYPFNRVERATDYFEVLVFDPVEVDPRMGLSNSLNVTAYKK